MATSVDSPAPRPSVVWRDDDMRSTYANVCNVTHTRDEVVVLFGTNRGWKGEGQPVTVELSDRMILSPYAAKRLARLLNGVVEQYEQRYGTLAIERPAGQSG